VTLSNVLKRLLMMVLVIWLAASINFILPKLSPTDPVQDKLAEMAESRSQMNDIGGLVASYNRQFGLDRSLWQQYASYLKNTATLDLGYSIAFYPARVSDMIATALPWTIGLVLTATLIAFCIGSLLGAVVAWRGAPKFVGRIAPLFMMLAALPYYLLGLVLVYVFAFAWRIFPLSGGYSLFSVPEFSLSFVSDVLYHSTLPALSIVLASIGTWALSMRGMMITVQGEDYMVYAEANGLGPVRRMLGYGLRNAMLPQVTSLAMHVGHIAGGAVLVERVFNYPGVGTLLFKAIEGSDYFVIYGVALVMVVMIALAMLIVDLVTPLIDPRVRH
jgi:peptide/nickel transport system permease protein